jgi:mRNA interferase HigB
MRIISVKRLREFWEKHPDAEQSLRIWAGDVQRSNWRKPDDIKHSYANASFLANNRVVFNNHKLGDAAPPQPHLHPPVDR